MRRIWFIFGQPWPFTRSAMKRGRRFRRPLSPTARAAELTDLVVHGHRKGALIGAVDRRCVDADLAAEREVEPGLAGVAKSNRAWRVDGHQDSLRGVCRVDQADVARVDGY